MSVKLKIRIEQLSVEHVLTDNNRVRGAIRGRDVDNDLWIVYCEDVKKVASYIKGEVVTVELAGFSSRGKTAYASARNISAAAERSEAVASGAEHRGTSTLPNDVGAAPERAGDGQSSSLDNAKG